jgi:Arc/MetJ-type ribon-helix-helix transcriptional regulator
MKIRTVKLPADLDRRLAERARRTRRSRSAVVRDAVTAYLKDSTPAAPGSFAEAARDLIGRLDGPADLSTNADYLGDFGR